MCNRTHSTLLWYDTFRAVCRLFVRIAHRFGGFIFLVADSDSLDFRPIVHTEKRSHIFFIIVNMLCQSMERNATASFTRFCLCECVSSGLEPKLPAALCSHICAVRLCVLADKKCVRPHRSTSEGSLCLVCVCNNHNIRIQFPQHVGNTIRHITGGGYCTLRHSACKP